MNLKNTPTPLFENLSTSPMSISLGICNKPPSQRPHCEGIVVEHDRECCQRVRRPHSEGKVVEHDRECCQWVKRPHSEGIVVEHDRECCQ